MNNVIDEGFHLLQGTSNLGFKGAKCKVSLVADVHSIYILVSVIDNIQVSAEFLMWVASKRYGTRARLVSCF